MGSDGNKMNDGTSLQLSDPILCANGCGFFGSAATSNLCSKCFRDSRIQNEQTASVQRAMEKLVLQEIPAVGGATTMDPPQTGAAVDEIPAKSNRCFSCPKKLGLVGFKCKCGSSFCGTHRFPEQHNCEFDYKYAGRQNIAKSNPVVKADKLDNRI